MTVERSSKNYSLKKNSFGFDPFRKFMTAKPQIGNISRREISYFVTK